MKNPFIEGIFLWPIAPSYLEKLMLIQNSLVSFLLYFDDFNSFFLNNIASAQMQSIFGNSESAPIRST